jgi:hypothetical protein
VVLIPYTKCLTCTNCMMYTRYMADMVLRDLDEEFMRRVRAQSALDGKSLKIWVVEKVSRFLEGKDGGGEADGRKKAKRG